MIVSMSDKHAVRPDERAAPLAAEQNRKMAASAQAYVRGSTKRFYDWLEDLKRTSLPDGPPSWICGDCHVGNLGPVASAAGSLAIQIRDLDQTVIGNPAHDLIRLGLSLAMAARSSALPGVTTAQMIEQVIRGYERAFAGEADPKPADLPKSVRGVLREAAGRSWKHLADERIEGLSPTIPLGKRFWPLSDQEHQAIRDAFAEEPIVRLVTALREVPDHATVRVLDAAFWRKGCSSLGRLRFAVLVAIGKGSEERHCLIDIKEAIAAHAPRAPDAEMPRGHAERVVTGARALSPFLGERMLATRLLGKPVFVRALLPQDLKLEFDRLHHAEALGVAWSLANVVGKAHARQLDRSDRGSWRAALGRNRSRALEAPSWLWNSVVELVATHEAAYLDHCRRYALAQAD